MVFLELFMSDSNMEVTLLLVYIFTVLLLLRLFKLMVSISLEAY